MAELLYKDEVYAIVGAAMEVYNDLGPGLLEPVYQEALQIECEWRGLPLEAQKQIAVQYKGLPLNHFYVADFIYPGKVIVELKALNHLAAREQGQLLNYLEAKGIQVGLLINFGAYPNLEWKRMVLTKGNKAKVSNNPAEEDSPTQRIPFANIGED